MKIYTRYVLFGVLKLFLGALLFSTLGLLFISIVKTSIQMGTPLSLFARIAPYLLPEILALTLPATALFAVTTFFAKMSANNEIIALKAIGVPPYRIMIPVWTLMLGVSLLGVWFNDLSISWTRVRLKNAILEGFESTLLNQLKTQQRFVTQTGEYEITVSDVLEDGTLINPQFSGKLGLNGRAESAKIDARVNLEKPVVNFRLKNAEFDAKQMRGFIPVEYNFSIPLDEIFNSQTRVDPPISRVKEALNNLELERRQYRRTLASNAMFSYLSGKTDGVANSEWKAQPQREKFFDKQRIRFKLLLPRFSAAGFSCFFFVWVGAPYAILVKKRDFTSTFFVSFLPIASVYFVLFSLGLECAKSGALPPYATWFGNIALAVIGAILLKKVH